jgi:hypothetical protein
MKATAVSTSRIGSLKASHSSPRNVFGFFGGIQFSPNQSLLLARSAGPPTSPLPEEPRWPRSCSVPPRAATAATSCSPRSEESFASSSAVTANSLLFASAMAGESTSSKPRRV